MKNLKRLFLILIILCCLLLFIVLNGIGITPRLAINNSLNSLGFKYNIEIMSSAKMKTGYYCLYTCDNTNIIGVAKVKNFLGILWVYSGSTTFDMSKYEKPYLEFLEFPLSSDDEYYQAIVVLNQNIKYIVVGTENEINDLNSLDKITLKEAKMKSKYYNIYSDKKYITIVNTNYSKEKTIIRAYDEGESLIAYSIYGYGIKYVK